MSGSCGGAIGANVTADGPFGPKRTRFGASCRRGSMTARVIRYLAGKYRLHYQVYGSGDRVPVWLHGLLLDANLGRGLARRLAARGNGLSCSISWVMVAATGLAMMARTGWIFMPSRCCACWMSSLTPGLSGPRTFAELWVQPPG
jgi:hypothetical protein